MDEENYRQNIEHYEDQVSKLTRQVRVLTGFVVAGSVLIAGVAATSGGSAENTDGLSATANSLASDLDGLAIRTGEEDMNDPQSNKPYFVSDKTNGDGTQVEPVFCVVRFEIPKKHFSNTPTVLTTLQVVADNAGYHRQVIGAHNVYHRGETPDGAAWIFKVLLSMPPGGQFRFADPDVTEAMNGWRLRWVAVGKART